MSHSILLIISGSIAAYKSLELIRRLRERDIEVRCILTEGGAQFVTPLAVSSLTGTPTYTELFSLKDEVEMGHIRLSREADLIVVAPASADLIAKMAHGLANDLASATLLAANKPIIIAPAMNTQMWQNAATQRNLEQIQDDGISIIAPSPGALACGETGDGRMAEVETILQYVVRHLGGQEADSASRQRRANIIKKADFQSDSGASLRKQEASAGGDLKGIKILVTSGPTHEAIDPVRYIANRSSGKQGHAIAAALAEHGASVTLIAGPTDIPDPKHVTVKHITTAEEMLNACEAALPVDIAICAAAVADWRVSSSDRKLKKRTSGATPELHLVENPDILLSIANHRIHRPKLVIGFAAETENMEKNAAEKRIRKNCDWIIANDVSEGKAFGAQHNQVMLITQTDKETWPLMSKDSIAQTLAERIIQHLKQNT